MLHVRRYSSANIMLMAYPLIYHRSKAMLVLPRAFLHFSVAYSVSSSQQFLQESIKAAVESKNYQQIPHLFNTSTKHSPQVENPFSFLSSLSESCRVHVVDEMLQSFIPIRPRNQLFVSYSCLLLYTLESPNPLPLALAVLQRTLRSGCVPAPQTDVLLANSWLESRQQAKSVYTVLSEMHSFGYSPDCGTCNYLILSLCRIGHFEEAVKVLRGMGRVGCIPDLDSYGALIGGLSEVRRTSEVLEMLREMVTVHGLNPRQDIVVKAVNSLRAKRDVWRAVEMIEFLESGDVRVGFEAYDVVLEGCLECRQFVLAGKFVIKMTGRGFIPYIRVRQTVVEGLVGVGESELASVVRQRFTELKS